MSNLTYTPEENQKSQRQWLWLIEEEEAQFQALCALDQQAEGWTEEKSKAVRRYWSIVNGALWMFVRCKAQADFDLKPFPTYILARLANISEELSNGHVLPILEHVKGQGRHFLRAERHAVAYAVLYVEAAKMGQIKDRAPVKTICHAYGVTRRTVQGWCKQRDELIIGVPHRGWGPDRLTEKMQESGRLYTVNGRGIGMTAEQWAMRK